MWHRKMPIRAAPFTHQRAAFEEAARRFGLADGIIRSRGYGLLFEMGCGKSLTAIAIAGALYLAGKIKRVLVVAPLSVLGVWDEEFAKYADFEYSLTVLTGDSTKKKAEALGRITGSGLQIAVVNYDSAKLDGLSGKIMTWSPDLIIADEGHKMKTARTNTSKAMHRFGARATYKLLLTGTVITNKAFDVFSQYKFLNPTIFGSNYTSFKNLYFDELKFVNFSKLTLKPSMERDLMERIHSIAFRATKSECLDLPETTDVIRHVDLEPEAMRVYRDLVRESYAELAKGEVTVTNVLTRLLRLSQLTGGFIGDDEGNAPQRISAAKLSALKDIVDGVLQEGKKIVVIARFVAEIKAICKMLEKRGIGYSCIMGGVTNREEQVTAFQNDPVVQVFVGQIATAGLGITLTAASTLVFYSTDYSMSNHEQAKARIHRVGQRHPCTYIYLAARKTIDEKVLAALRNKADLARTLVDDYRNGGNIFG